VRKRPQVRQACHDDESAPVSDFANDHTSPGDDGRLPIHHNSVEWLDGTVSLELATGGAPPAGSTAQVGVIDERQAAGHAEDPIPARRRRASP
jgi:hypothetical protein